MRRPSCWTAAAWDLVAVLVFAAIGRASHGEDVALAGVWTTAGPFAAGWAVGWVLVLVVRPARTRPYGLLAGALVWLLTVAVGMVLRPLVGAGVQTSFVVVTAVVLAVFLLGWRLVAGLVGRRRSRRRDAATAEV